MSMKEAKRSALKSLIKSMNMKRMGKKKVPEDEMGESKQEEDNETADEEMQEEAGGMEPMDHEDEADGHAEPELGHEIKKFMQRGGKKVPSRSPGASLTVVMSSMGGKKRK